MTAFTLRTHANRNENGRVVRYAPGDIVDIVGDAEIERLVRAGAISVDEPEVEPVADDAATGDESHEGDVAEDSDPADNAEDSDPADNAEDEPEDADGDDDQDPARPRKAGPRDAWIEYAVAKGLDRAEAEAMTKPQLWAWAGVGE